MAINAELSDLQAATALAGGELIYVVQGDNSRKATLGASGASILEHATSADTRNFLDVPSYVADRTTLKALDTTKETAAFLSETGRQGIFVWTAGDYSTEISTDTLEGVYVKANAIASTAGAWVRAYDGAVNVKWFGAVDDYSGGTQTGTDNTAAFTAALVFCEDNRQSLYVPGGLYFFDGGKLTIGGAVVLHGDGRSVTYLVFGGNPTKEVITRVIWRSEYDLGDFSSNSDAAVAWGIRVSTQNASIEKLTVMTNHNVSTVYPLPFNSATDYPTSNYEYGIIVQRANDSIKSVDVTGVWATSAFVLDGSDVGGIGDGFYAEDCNFFGGWGVRILGAQGQPVSGDDYLALAALDTRTSGGISDVEFHRCNIGDTSRGTRLNINGTLKRVRRSATGGGLYINGQLGLSVAERIQGIAFFKCRFSSSDPTVYKVNYANRVEFYSCHSEPIGGSFNTDGVTPLAATDMSIVTTSNAMDVAYFGGEKSGETDSRTMKTATERLVSEYGFDNTTRQLTVVTLGDGGSWTPAVVATTPGTPAYTVQDGRYLRIGQQVTVWGRVTFSAITGMSGNLSLNGFPFLCTNEFGATHDPTVTVAPQTVTLGTGGMSALLNNNTTSASLFKVVSGGATVNMTAADLAATSRFDFSCTYITSDP